ncbi:siphovirus ReqiPepy6 Gp37-like family protein [Candidatus Saccharibacteria bacterium]|nr:siphovirus ReqiPepy6 Gp37-like family protein [Candidatus Saccharibacteria bacterium]MBQ6127141.1 siphovirus ReqiPepy6 Gp37-like family protein [Candidatus Saccharibacteria bacterium]
MECNIYDKTLTKVGIISDFVSMRWAEQYSDTGSFYLTVNKDAETLSLLQKGIFIGVRPYDTLMYIYSTEDKNGQIWAYGAEAKWLLTQRVYDGKLVCSNVESTLKTAVMAQRPLPILGTAPDRGLTGRITSQRSYATLFDMSKAWCDSVGYGFRLVHDRAARLLRYDVYEGQVQPNAVYSEKYRNMQNLVRTQSEKMLANVAIVRGGGEGEDRTKVYVGDTTSTGFERQELYVDARDIVFDENEMTQSEYEDMLRARGSEKLAEKVAVDEITFDISSDDYGTVVHLGDTIRCSLPEYGLTASVRITGVTMTYEQNVQTVSLSLGTPVLRSSIRD